VTATGATAAEGRGADVLRGTGTRALAVAVSLALAGFAARPGPAAGASAGSAPAVEIRVSRQGFEPSVVTLRKGEAVQIVVSSGDGEHCFAVDGFRLEKRVLPGRATRFEFTPERAGRFPFYCCIETGKAAEVERGELVVTE
jgi:heme/copper-type cytochrome/quinol oxidase subunit 2